MRMKRVWVACGLVSIGTLGTTPASAEGPEATYTDGEPGVSIENCPRDPRRPRAMRCLSSRLVPQAAADGRARRPLTPPPDAGEGVDASIDISACDGLPVAGGFSSTSGLTAANLANAYSIPSSPTGAGKVVAIVDACNEATIVADVAAYRAKFGLPPLRNARGRPGTPRYLARRRAWGS